MTDAFHLVYLERSSSKCLATVLVCASETLTRRPAPTGALASCIANAFLLKHLRRRLDSCLVIVLHRLPAARFLPAR